MFKDCRAARLSAWVVALSCLTGGWMTLHAQQPVNPNSSQKTRDVLQLLYDLQNRPDRKVISGQVLRTLDQTPPQGGMPYVPYADVNDRIQMIHDNFGYWVGIVGAEYTDWFRAVNNQPQSTQKILSAELNPHLIAHSQRGGIAALHFHPNSPRSGTADDPGITGDDLLNPGTVHDNWMRILRDAAAGLKELRDNDVVVLWRPMHGADLGWWWSPSGGGLSNADYRRVWSHMVNYFSNDWGLDNILYFQSWYGGGIYGDITQLYAGDSNVDIVGIDNNVWSSQEYDTILSFGKPVGISESWADGILTLDGSVGSGSYDMRRVIDGIRANSPKCAFFIQFDHPRYAQEHIAANLFGFELLSDPWVLNAPIFGGPPQGDTTPPTVRITSPADGATVSGSITLSADAFDNVAVDRVEFYVDGGWIHTEYIAAYRFSWDTTQISDGTHTFMATAYDPSGNSATATIDVTVSNGGGGAYTLTAAPSTVGPGDTLTVTWTTPSGQGNSSDWIGLYAAGADNASYLDFQYASGADSGTLTFAAPAADGMYEFRYLLNNSYTSAATSNPFTVRSGGGGGSLVAYWTFNDGAGQIAADSSGFGNDGILVNGPEWGSGVSGGALRFNGADTYVTAGPSGSLTDLGPLSVAAWIRPDIDAPASGRIVGNETGGPGRWMLFYGGSRHVVFVKDHSTQELRRSSAVDVLTPGEWHHVAVTWDGGSSAAGVHLYVNGAEVGYSLDQSGIGVRVSDAGAPVTIGNRWPELDRGFGGSVDDVRLYNRVLSAGEVAGIMAFKKVAGGGPAANPAGGGSSSGGGGCGATGAEALFLVVFLCLRRALRR